ANDSETIDYEYRIKNSKGEWRIFRSYDAVFARANDGTILEMLGTAMDITESKRLEEEIKKYSGQLEKLVDIRTKELSRTNEMLKREIEERAKVEKSIIEAEEKFRSLVENSPFGIYILQDDNFIYTNPKFGDIFGFRRDELTGTYIYDTIQPDYRNKLSENIKRLLNNEIHSVQYAFKGIKKDGSEIDIEVRGTKMNYKGRVSIIGSLIDITEHKQHEEAILEQQQFLKTVIDTSPGFIFAKDWDGKFTLANKSVADIYGTTVVNLIGKRDADFNSNIDEIEHFINDDREVISRRKPKIISEEIVTNSVTNESRWYQTVKIPLTDKNGNTQVLGISTDITERKLAEEMTKKSLNEKEMLLKEIHHRVKNNLQIIVSLLKLQSRYLYDSKDLEMFNDSRSRVETMSMIHEKLYKTRNLANINIGNYLSDLMNNILKSQRNGQKDIELEFKYDNVLLGIDTAIPCGLIINELLLNIIKYSFDHSENKKIKFLLKNYDDKIHIHVSDNGRGISGVKDINSPDSLGFQLIEMLVKQLEGEMTIINDEGTNFCLSFKELIYKERI
ncbi:MAG TPA: PAS domain S-box protein, partial [Ignavibacteria bacterium]